MTGTPHPAVDEYLARSERWPDVIAALRPVLLEAGLDESVKWRKPCYTHDGRNICIVQEMKDFVALMFFKGALLPDPAGILEDQGPNSRSAKRIVLRSVDDVQRLAGAIAEMVRAATEVEDAGVEVAPPPEPDIAPELQELLDRDPRARAGWETLTPGRRREYALHLSSAKQPETRRRRVAKIADRIRSGKGLRDR